MTTILLIFRINGNITAHFPVVNPKKSYNIIFSIAACKRLLREVGGVWRQVGIFWKANMSCKTETPSK